MRKTNLATSLEKVRILIDLETIPGYNTILGTCILYAVYFKVPADELFNFIREYYKRYEAIGYESIVNEVIGEELVLRICEFQN